MSSAGPPVRPPAGAPGPPAAVFVVLGLIIVAALGGAVLLFLTEDDDGGGGDQSSTPLSTESASVNVEFAPTAVNHFNGGGPPVQLSPEQVAAIMDVAGRYLDQGVIEPLATGEPVGDLSGLFDAATAAQIPGARGVLFEEGLPKATGGIEAKAPLVEVSGLSDATGMFVLASVGSSVDIVAKTDDGDLTIHRVTDLTLMPEGTTWKIAGFKVQVLRQGAGVRQPTARVESER